MDHAARGARGRRGELIMSQRHIVFYRSLPHECGYLPHRRAVNAVMDPAVTPDVGLYSRLVERGFRRSGSRIYRPACPDCSACIPLRIPVPEFRPNRTQRRIWRRNLDLDVTECSPDFRAEHYALYTRYVQARHPAGGMEESSAEDYHAFLVSRGIETRFIEFREAGRCVAVAVVDVLADGHSAVYTFFDPDLAQRSLGVYAVLWEIEAVRRSGGRWLYLGYWISECRKMRYKDQYRPCEVYLDGGWQRL